MAEVCCTSEKNSLLLDGLLTFCNSLNAEIQFTHELEKKSSLPFLDVLVIRKQNNLELTVYRKPTHTGAVLPYDSCHSMQNKKGVIHTLLHRAHLVCTNTELLNDELRIVRSELGSAGYPQKLINTTEKKVKMKLQTSDQKQEEEPTTSFSHSFRSPNVI